MHMAWVSPCQAAGQIIKLPKDVTDVRGELCGDQKV
jgi:hypothetical protein